MSTVFEFLEPRWLRWRRWAVAGMLMAALHVGGAAAALWQWPEHEVEEDPEGALMLELAPMAVAPREELLNLALGPLSEESVPTPPVEEVKQSEIEEIPPVDESPLAPEPEVELEKILPTEVEEKVEETPQEMQAQTVAASQAAAPPPIEAAEGDKPAAPYQGASLKPSQAQVSWQKALHIHLNKHKRYPGEARNRRIQGVVTVVFSIDRTGNVTERRILKGSGSHLLDDEALAMLERASPLPAPPEESPTGALTLSLPIQFNIR